jgi:hypothetical protein
VGGLPRFGWQVEAYGRHRQWHISGWRAIRLAPAGIPIILLIALAKPLLASRHLPRAQSDGIEIAACVNFQYRL